ncbi:MAG: DUF58 domain-containing protein [Cellulosilyticum sp.]|nr:DUF58 domain-containing protein [Cellulosilyticum sp.]
MEIIAIIVLVAIGIRFEIEIYKRYILHKLVYECSFSKDEVIEGELVEIVELVMNPTSLFVPCLKSEISTNNLLEFAGNASTVNDQTRSLASLFSIRGKQKVKRVWKVRTLQRGAFRLLDTTVIASDLFGCYHYSNILRLNSELIVLPKPIDVSGYIQKVKEIQGDRVVKRFILEDPFVIAGVREYTTRDSMNKIHWGITARAGQLMVRNNEATSKKSLTVIVNNQLTSEQLNEPMHDERLEYGIRVAAGLLDQTLKDSTPVRLLANGAVDNNGQSLDTYQMWGKAHVHSQFVLLARLKNTFTEHFDKFLDRYESSIQSTELIIVTCYIDETILNFIRNKQRAGISAKVYLMSYEADSKHYEDVEVYYLLDYLKEVGER